MVTEVLWSLWSWWSFASCSPLVMDVLVLVVLVVMQISLEFVCVSKIRLQLGISPLRRQRVTDFPQLIVCLIPWLWKLCHNSVPNPPKSISWSNDRLFTVPYFFVRSFRYTASYRKMVARNTKRATSTILQRQYSPPNYRILNFKENLFSYY